MCSVSSLYGDQATTGLLKSYKGWGKVLYEIQFEFKIPQHKPINLMNEPYVYSRSKLNDISQNNNNNLKCTKPDKKYQTE